MEYHSERPLTGSVPAHQHDFDVTPNDRMFVRNNLLTPVVDIDKHRLTITGLVDKELSWSVYELPKAFASVTVQGMLECADRRRPSDYERHHHVRKDDHVPKRDDGQGFVDFHSVP